MKYLVKKTLKKNQLLQAALKRIINKTDNITDTQMIKEEIRVITKNIIPALRQQQREEGNKKLRQALSQDIKQARQAVRFLRKPKRDWPKDVMANVKTQPKKQVFSTLLTILIRT